MALTRIGHGHPQAVRARAPLPPIASLRGQAMLAIQIPVLVHGVHQHPIILLVMLVDQSEGGGQGGMLLVHEPAVPTRKRRVMRVATTMIPSSNQGRSA
jgi:hypothetical protein